MTEGKTIDEIQEEMSKIRPITGGHEELSDEEVIEMAKQAGIETEGKPIEELQEEIRASRSGMGLNEDDLKK